MTGHVAVQTRTDGNRDFEIMEASWNEGRVEVHLRTAGSDVGERDEVRLRLDGMAVTEIVAALTRFATDAELGVIE